MINLLASLFFLVSPVQAEVVDMTLWGGINTSVDSVAIIDGQCQDCLNVEVNKTGTSMRKRGGYVEAFDLDPSNDRVDSQIKFRNSSGDECHIMSSDGTVYRATNGAAPVQVTTITATARLYCQENSGLAYCFSSNTDDTPFTDDCSAFTLREANDYPRGKANAFSIDRQFVIGSTTQPNNLYASKSGDFTDFRTGTAVEDAFFEEIGTPGDSIEGVYTLNGRVILMKEYSIMGFNLTDQYNANAYDISDRIGIANPEAVSIRQGWAYFKASDNEIYRINGLPGVVEKLSIPISSQTAALLTGRSRSNTQTNKADWDLGNLSASGAGFPMRSDIIVGSVVPSSVTFIDTSSAQFAAGTLTNLSVTDTIGSLTLSSSTFKDNFDDGNTTSSPTWTVDENRVFASNSFGGTNWSNCASGAGCVAYTTSTVSTGTFSFARVQVAGGSGNTSYTKFISTGPDFDGAQGYALKASGASSISLVLQKYPGASTICSGAGIKASGVKSIYTVTRDSSGNFEVFEDDGGITPGTSICTGTDAAYGASSNVVFKTDTNVVYHDEYNFYGYFSSGSLTSQSFDTTFTSPMWGVFNSTFTTSDNTLVFFYTQSSPDQATWSAVAATSDTLRITSPQDRYLRYRADLYTTSYATHTPVVQAVSLLAATTGQFTTQCINTTPIDSWGIIQAGGSYAAGESQFTFEYSTGTDCNDVGSSYTAISTGTTISIATGSASKVRVTFDINSATNSIRLDDIIINWNEGSVAPPSYASYWNDGIYFAVADAGTTNNKVLKLDLLNSSWFLFDIPMNAPYTFNNIFHFGSPTSGKVFTYSSIDNAKAPSSDNGANINARFKTKDYGGGNPFTESIFNDISIIAKKEEGGDVNVTWKLNGGGTATESFTVALSTGDNAVRHNYRLAAGQRGTFFNLEFSDNSTDRFEIIGVRVSFDPQPWRELP